MFLEGADPVGPRAERPERLRELPAVLLMWLPPIRLHANCSAPKPKHTTSDSLRSETTLGRPYLATETFVCAWRGPGGEGWVVILTAGPAHIPNRESRLFCFAFVIYFFSLAIFYFH